MFGKNVSHYYIVRIKLYVSGRETWEMEELCT